MRPAQTPERAAPPRDVRRALVTRAQARVSAERVEELHDQPADISDAAYQLLVGEGGPLLLALASADPNVRGQAQGRLRALSQRYRALVEAELFSR